ncbi:DUF4340 domain-containing protein [Paenibacillus sp. J2TS4]|uniref:DUF4340 domain-containing protein n=1 Tax=Paenibacillus sp. J2TS4 TaxID=2807194 RepID=UPI001B19E35A|nr:DUF4340 domain-containing protein [Paenibacillus sp. J2TS4]GIP35653.1 hypothetical protein J2TS4_48630 [Paenibacillus sp. J2TS4]
MKKFIPTLVLVVLCIAGFSYASSQNWFKDSAEDEAKELLSIPAEEVEKIAISSADNDSEELGPTVQLVKENDGWRISDPVPYPVNLYMVDNWLGTFAGLSYTDKVEENPAELESFGLESPDHRFEVTLKDGTVKKIGIGNPLPIGDGYYAKADDDPAVYSISGYSVQSLNKQVIDFIDKSAFKVDYNLVNAISLVWKGESIQLDKLEPDKNAYESKWKLDGQEVEANAGSGVLDKLTMISTAQLPIPAGEANLDGAELRVEVKEGQGEEAQTVIFIGKIENGKVNVAREGAEWAFIVEENDLDQLWEQAKQVLASAADNGGEETIDGTSAETGSD